MLESQPSLRTIELAKLFNVTDETIRRDLESLDAENKLIRTHGGALRIEKRVSDLPLHKRLKENRNAKQEIAAKALALIRENETILLDSSSTALALAEALPDMKLTVITNAHDVVMPLMAKTAITTVMTGGKLDRESHSFGGLLSWSAVKKFSVDKIFFSGNGLDLERGASEVVEMHAEFKENVLPLCHERIMLCDSTKFGVRSTRFFADFDLIDKIITDSNADPSFLQKLEAIGAHVL